MKFCPRCANLLLLTDSFSEVVYTCPTCTFSAPIEEEEAFPLSLRQKEVDDVLGGPDAWKNVDRTEAKCTQCDHNQAFYMQVQIRSADEPMTTFYKCCSCKHQWND